MRIIAHIVLLLFLVFCGIYFFLGIIQGIFSDNWQLFFKVITLGAAAVISIFILYIIDMFVLAPFRWNKKNRERCKAEETQKAAEYAINRRKKILSYPVKTFTQEEFDELPCAPDRKFLETAPIGVWFICSDNPLPDVIVVGQVVVGDDLLCDQWGAGLCIPERGINRYQAKIV